MCLWRVQDRFDRLDCFMAGMPMVPEHCCGLGSLKCKGCFPLAPEVKLAEGGGRGSAGKEQAEPFVLAVLCPLLPAPLPCLRR